MFFPGETSTFDDHRTDPREGPEPDVDIAVDDVVEYGQKEYMA